MAKYKMADDFDDGNMGKEDSAYVAQFENVINDIKSQLHTTNPAELARLNSAISSLLASNLPAKILKSLEALQAAVVKEEQRAEQNITYRQEEEARAAATKLQDQIDFLEMEAEKLEAERLLAQFNQEGSRLEKQHAEFKVEIAKRIEETKEETRKHNELFDYISDENLKGKDIDESKLRPFIKNEEQIERDRKLYRHQKAAHKHYDGLCAYDAKLKTEKEELKDAVKKEQQKPKELQSSILLETAKQRIKHKDERREELKPAIAKAKAEMDDTDKQIWTLEQEKGDKPYKKLADKYKHTDTEKYQILTEFDSLIKNQENAIKNDEPVADIGQRDAFLNDGNLPQENKLPKNIADIEERNAFLNDASFPQEDKLPKNVKHQQAPARISPNDVNIPQNLEQDKLQKEAKDIVNIANKKFLSLKVTLAKPPEKVTNSTCINNTNNLKKDPKGHTR
ncbi:hypothetical protein [Candidatus Tisiphia endosymbiont of Empis tessellata]|uniref:hypothetical protein n=1 Tax=Candidatus Tisiphia endosymbiont of Empis tessellata TaxID=3066259 RepID=UPI00313C159E